MSTGLAFGISGICIWVATHLAEADRRIQERTATALYCIALMLAIAAALFVIGSVGPAS